MQKNNDTQDVHFYVRASYDIAIQLYQTPGMLFPCFTVRFNLQINTKYKQWKSVNVYSRWKLNTMVLYLYYIKKVKNR